MNDFYIKLENGVPVGAPFAAENLAMIFPLMKQGIPPEGYVPFMRHMPSPQKYQVVIGESYEMIDGVVQDVWLYQDMTPEEQIALDQSTAVYQP